MMENVKAGRENAAKEKLPLRHSALMKGFAFILAVLLLIGLVAAALGAVLMIEYGVYTDAKEEFLEELNGGQVYSDTQILGWYVGRGEYQEAVDTVMSGRNVAAAHIVCSGEQNWTWGHGNMEDSGHIYEQVWNYCTTENGMAIPGYGGSAENTMLIRVRIAEKPQHFDSYLLYYCIAELCYGLRYAIYPAALLMFALCILCIVFLMKSAGCRPKRPGVTPSWATAIPSDLLTAAVVGLEVLLIGLLAQLSYEEEFLLVFALPIAATMAALVLGWFMSIAIRIKLGSLWRNTLIFRLLKLLWRGAKALWRVIKRFCRFILNLRFFWQVGLAFSGLAIVELFFILITGFSPGAEVVLWLLEMIVLLAGLSYFCLMLRELRRCGKAVAEGDMSFEPDTRLMPRAFREHAEDLKGISETVNKAVEQKMRSERMKTELITNVSHDLKTPLTSLINYSDLICRSDCENPKHREYADVLHRQSERMKRLIDDLVEASKASSGNMEIELSPCAVDVLLAQAAAEYENRLAQAGLTPVFAPTKELLKIMADGRRLWRVMDNLMNNICKYALSGTRVYFAAERAGNEVVISFKNTSREQLNLSGEELAERFVRGDASRGSEGSGLGLSIARSLTELQGGKMEIICDGDLFKVQLKFPYID